MSHNPRNPHSPADPPPSPSPELRERVLRLCRQEMLARRREARRRSSRWRWSLAAGVGCLLLMSFAQERQTETRIAAIVQGPSQPLVASRVPPRNGRLLLARASLLAAILRDPDSL